MGVQSRIVVAAPDEGPALLASDEPTYVWPCVTINGFHNIHLETLFSVISEIGISSSKADQIVENAGERDRSISLFHVPDAVRDAYAEIAEIGDDDVVALSRRWAAIPEWAGWDFEDVKSAAATIGELADIAKWSDKSLWLWISG
jgi:hypothetical protein